MSDGFGLILIVSAAESAFPGICPESRRTALLGGKRCLGCTQSLRKRQSLPQEQISAPIEKFHCRFLYFAGYPHKSAAHGAGRSRRRTPTMTSGRGGTWFSTLKAAQLMSLRSSGQLQWLVLTADWARLAMGKERHRLAAVANVFPFLLLRAAQPLGLLNEFEMTGHGFSEAGRPRPKL